MTRAHTRHALVAALALVGAASLAAQTPTKPVSLPGTYDRGYLVFQSADSAFRYWLDGRLQVDGAVYTNHDNKLANGTEVRRARFGVKSDLYRDWHAELDVDFTGNAIEMKDMWLGYQGFANTLIKGGNFKEPFSLETLTSSKQITFMERSYADNFSPDRNIGLAVVRWGDNWQTTVGAFGQTAGSPDASAQSEGYGLTGRFTFAPLHDEENVVHLGLAASRRTPNAGLPADADQMRFRARPETYVSAARFLTTGKIKNVNYTTYYNGEMALMHGPASFQAEYTGVGVHRLGTLPVAGFGGGYVFASYMLTGESKEYLVSEGEFDRVHPRSAGGAWEVAARVSTMNLNDFDTGVGIAGGRATNVTLGVNWYINTNFKWVLNVVRVLNDNNAKPDLGPGPFVTGDKFNIIQTRFALAF